MSAIGVPGMARGDADVHVTPVPTQGGARMRGYLTPDQHANFGFAPSEHEEFHFGPKSADPCASCTNEIGFRLRHLDGHTLAPAAHDNEVFSTGSSVNGQANREAERLIGVINAVPGDDVIMLETFDNRSADMPAYHAPVSDQVTPANWVALAQAVASGAGRATASTGSPASTARRRAAA